MPGTKKPVGKNKKAAEKKIQQLVDRPDTLSVGISGSPADIAELAEEIRKIKGSEVLLWHKQ